MSVNPSWPIHQILAMAPMVACVTLAATIDIRTRRIPNWLTASLAIAGLAQAFLPGALVTPGAAWAGLGAGLGLTLVLFVAGAMGGGDVKLIAGIGAWVGPLMVLHVFAAAAIVGMFVVIARALANRQVAGLLRNSTVLVLNAATTGDLRAPSEAQRPGDDFRNRIPYAVPILAGMLVVLVAHAWRWL